MPEHLVHYIWEEDSTVYKHNKQLNSAVNTETSQTPPRDDRNLEAKETIS